MRVKSGSNAPRTLSVLSRSRVGDRGDFRINSLLWMAGIALLLVPITTLIDIPIARWFATDPLPGQLGDALDLSLVYAHGTGIFFILVSVILLAPRRRWHVPRMAVLAMGGGAVATLIKMFVLRQRPNSIPNLDILGHDYAWNWSFDWSLQYVAYFDASTRAFPSAYLATATALTVGLCVVFPRGRWLFVALCLSTMIQRMYCGSHFISDLFGSAFVGLFWAFVCHHPSLLGNLFDKIEPEKMSRRARLSALRPTVQASDDDQETDRVAA